jgi:serine/threonine protein kinase
MVGEVLLDRYELEELVGSGGMSSVYRAHDRLLDRTVALKILHERHLQEPEYVERFRREARSAAVLSHPNIVTVIDRGEHGGQQFIVFEFVGGDNLKRLIEQSNPLPVSTALELAIQIARGLSFAHRNGLVHRDVKPQNVLLNGDGQAKVTDFGIARSLDVKRGMTETGTVLGTSDYIAPEQAQGMHVDEQTDVYSLGVVLYELLTGEVPFPGENFVTVGACETRRRSAANRRRGAARDGEGPRRPLPVDGRLRTRARSVRRGHRGGDADHRTGKAEAGPARSILGMAARPPAARADRDRRRRRLPALPRLGKLVAGRRRRHRNGHRGHRLRPLRHGRPR